MNLHLIDYNGHLVTAWIEVFEQFPDVAIEQGDLLAVARNCVVSPANSYGFMDGGITNCAPNIRPVFRDASDVTRFHISAPPPPVPLDLLDGLQ